MQVLAAALVGVYAEDNAKAIPFYLKYLEEIFNVLRINITDNGCVVPVCSSWFLDPLVHCWVDQMGVAIFCSTRLVDNLQFQYHMTEQRNLVSVVGTAIQIIEELNGRVFRFLVSLCLQCCLFTTSRCDFPWINCCVPFLGKQDFCTSSL